MKSGILSYQCPYCDHEVRVGEQCPGCAKKRKTAHRRSWEQDESTDGLDLPGDDFDYDDFIAREFGNTPHRKIGLAWYWWLLAIIVLVGMIALVF